LFFSETGSYYVAQAGLELLGSKEFSACATLPSFFAVVYFLAVLGFELMASRLPGRQLYHLFHSASPVRERVL
jgi:hypothetical protein